MSLLLDDIRPDVVTNVADGYEGHCKLILQGSYSEEVVVFPNLEEAESAATAAVEPVVGGYHGAEIEMTTDAVTHETAEEWFFLD